MSGIGTENRLTREPFRNQSSYSQDYDMVIISPEIFSDEIQQLIEHKNSVGIHSILKTTEDIYNEYDGVDKAEQIKYFIMDAIEEHNIKYVLLIGGRKGQTFRWHIPARYSNVFDGFMHYKFLSDLYFADIYDKNDDFEDWDSNDNQIYSEWNDDNIEDVVYFLSVISLGRLP
jgi:hypothetical protein